MRCPHCHRPITAASEKPFYTTAEAAVIAQVAVQTIVNWANAGDITYSRIGPRGRRRIPKRPFLERMVKYGVARAKQELDLLDEEGAYE